MHVWETSGRRLIGCCSLDRTPGRWPVVLDTDIIDFTISVRAWEAEGTLTAGLVHLVKRKDVVALWLSVDGILIGKADSSMWSVMWLFDVIVSWAWLKRKLNQSGIPLNIDILLGSLTPLFSMFWSERPWTRANGALVRGIVITCLKSMLPLFPSPILKINSMSLFVILTPTNVWLLTRRYAGWYALEFYRLIMLDLSIIPILTVSEIHSIPRYLFFFISQW